MSKAVKSTERYFTASEVELHNSSDDLWVSWLGKVYDLTPLAIHNKSDPLLGPILKFAGKDVSHWFDPQTEDLKTHVNPLTGCVCYYTPWGRFLDVPPALPRSDWRSEPTIPWWIDKEKYFVGKLSAKTRKIRIVNMLTKDEHILEVCSEEKMNAIQERYMAFNAHAKGYMWKRLGILLDMTLTLEQNGIRDESLDFERTGITEDEWLPVIHLYFRYARYRAGVESYELAVYDSDAIPT
ncbi:uncharacterized protein BJ171DRAFT_567535 [Polychytrium aggregatum]|uniref:uncharacterized protein n=1 Tax=Polychytrium aggregatum TaxID=110093 RepID=UPI0022FDB143|nr:uncharacterized protein BJ171DRAFT_567535 [Polychytrium aggregatum]KAI9205356.1 hypothetical protein BJ171DRAFT_567535 [Polychytrium aggregatum]